MNALVIDPPTSGNAQSIIGFVNMVRTIQRVMKENFFQTDQAAAVQFKAFEINTILVCGDLIRFREQLFALAAFVDSSTAAAAPIVSLYNTAVDNYAAAIISTRPPLPDGYPSTPNMDQIAQNDMNAAITAYNSALTLFQFGLIDQVQMDAATAAYGAAVVTYNDYATARNTSLAPAFANLQIANDAYNAAIGFVNTTLQLFNAQSASGGGPIVPLFPTITTTAADAQNMDLIQGLPTAPPPNVAGLPAAPSHVTPPTINGGNGLLPQVRDAFSANYDDITVSLLKAIQKKNNVDEETDDQITNKRLNIVSNNPLNDLQFIRNTRQVESSPGSTGSVGAGVGFQALSSGMSTPSLNGQLSRALTKAILLAVYPATPLEEGLKVNFDNLQKVPEQLLLQSGIYGIQHAANLLGDASARLLPDSKTANVAASFGFAAQLVSLGLSNAPKNVFSALLEAKGLSPAEAEAVGADLADGFKLTAALYALYAISSSTNTPGLVGQILNAAGGIEGLNELLQQAQSKTFNDALNDTSARLFLSSALSDRLATLLGVSKQSADMIVSGALQGSVGKSPFISDFEFRIDLQRGFAAQGVNQDTAAQLANNALDFLKAEVSLPELSDSIDKANIQKSIVQNDYFHQNAVTDSVNQSLLNQDIVTNRDLRDSITRELQTKGQNYTDAFNTANEALRQLNADSQAKNAINVDTASRQLIASQLQSAIIQSQTAFSQKNSDGTVQPVINEASISQVALSVAKQVSDQQRFDSETAFRDFVARQLQSAGLSADIAHAAALATPLPALPQTIANAKPLENSHLDNLVSQDQITSQLQATITASLKNEIGVQDATRIATEVTNLISGKNPNSVVRLVQDSVSSIKETKNKDAIHEMHQLFLDFLKPNQDLAVLVDDLNSTKLFLKLVGAPMYQTTTLPPELTRDPISLQG